MGLAAAAIGLGGISSVEAADGNPAPVTEPPATDGGGTVPVDPPEPPKPPEPKVTRTTVTENVTSDDTKPVYLTAVASTGDYGSKGYDKTNAMPLDAKVTSGNATVMPIATLANRTTTMQGTKSVTTVVTETYDVDGKVIKTDTVTEAPVYTWDNEHAVHTDDPIANVLNIKQTSQRAIINWGSFDVGSKSKVNFIQTNSAGELDTSAMTLNEVSGNNLSTIAGKINSIGTFILTNPNGIYFTEGSQVDAAGIVASTNAIDHTRFMRDGELYFYQTQDENNRKNAGILINGTLKAGTMVDSELNSAENTELRTQIGKILASSPLNTSDLKLATGFSRGTDSIRIVANGDIAVGKTGVLDATRTTQVSTGGTTGTEGYSVGGSVDERIGGITLRADANADDVAAQDTEILLNSGLTEDEINAIKEKDTYQVTSRGQAAPTGVKLKTAKVYLNNDTPIASRSVGIYFDADITDKGINGTDVTTVGVENGAGQPKFTQKNYVAGAQETAKMRSHVAVTPEVTIDIDGELKPQSKTNPATKYKIAPSNYTTNFAMLINDPYQLQAIQDTEKVNSTEKYYAPTDPEALKNKVYYGNLGASYVLGTGMTGKSPSVNMAAWNNGKGFNPIGDEENPFTGSFSGNGIMGYGIYDLAINRPDENNVGLFARTVQPNPDTWVYFNGVTIIDASVKGGENVGALVGHADTGTSMSSVVNRKRYIRSTTDELSKIEVFDKTTGEQVNVSGEKNVGGLIGQMTDSRMFDDSHNQGYVKGGENVGGLVGSMTGTAGDTTDEKGNTVARTNNYIRNSYNSGWISNDMSLGAVNDYEFDDKGEITAKLVDQTSYGTSESRGYKVGVVEGTTNVGGLVGSLSGTS